MTENKRETVATIIIAAILLATMVLVTLKWRVWPQQFRAEIDDLQTRVEQLEGP